MNPNFSLCVGENFRDLEELVNLWSARLEENLCRFHEQVAACNLYFFKIASLRNTTPPIARQIYYLQQLQEEVNTHLECVKYNLSTTEQAVSLLEQVVPNTCKCLEGNCSFHTQPYHLLDDVYCSIRNLEGMLAGIAEELPYFGSNEDLIEQVAGVMQADLQELENIEMKTEHIKGLLSQVEYSKNLCLHVYGLQQQTL